MSTPPRLALTVLSLAGLGALGGACDDGGTSASSFSVEHRAELPEVSTGDAAGTDDAADVATTVADTATGIDARDTSVTTTPPADTSVTTTPPADTSVAPDTTVAQDTATSPDTTVTDPSPVDINVGFIGGACAGAGDCDFASGECLAAADGWPGGMCTEACTKYCPDQAGAVTTFCIDGQDFGETGGICAQQCDFGASPTGCRQGYHCIEETRFNDPTTLRYVCVPGTGELEASGCIQELIAKGIGFTLASNPMDTPNGGDPSDICDVADPIYLDPVIDGVTFHEASFDATPTRMFVTCPVALALWDTVQLLKERNVTDVMHLGTYNCRYIAGTTTLSEHAFANAIDLAGFENTDGDRWTVLDDWVLCDTTPPTAAGEFLYWLAQQMFADSIWNIILNPEYNAAHANHYHVDLTEGAHFLAECQ